MYNKQWEYVWVTYTHETMWFSVHVTTKRIKINGCNIVQRFFQSLIWRSLKVSEIILTVIKVKYFYNIRFYFPVSFLFSRITVYIFSTTYVILWQIQWMEKQAQKSLSFIKSDMKDTLTINPLFSQNLVH